ncbi:prephenate dehydratase [Candidatus Marinamargulisbacteria bacterium SCGC AAA071-K20]|nr:prephenate dehydratase [Candidatus Marinamargulisbacteria bacterium SCGC AAA071-K20]
MNLFGFLGPKGTFSEIALKTYLKNEDVDVECMGYASIDKLFLALDSKRCSAIIVPVENSVEGSVTTVVDHLIKLNDTFITAEFVLKIEHNLMVKDESKSITDIISHYQPIAQCRHYLESNYPDVDLNNAESTAKAADFVSDYNGDKVYGVIGHESLAKRYGFNIMDRNINDSKENVTRFFIISRKPTEPTGNDKSTIVFSTMKDQSGSLANVLNEFQSKSINLTHISSRPTKTSLGEYLFYIDCEGHFQDEILSEVLKLVEKKTSYIKCLGSYKKGGK